SLLSVFPGSHVPDTCRHAARILPAWLLTESVGWINGIGSSGSAALLFITGLLTSR
ncbi:hypothetical protein ARMGADRAFT_915594, partial [Armillaria gallica]